MGVVSRSNNIREVLDKFQRLSSSTRTLAISGGKRSIKDGADRLKEPEEVKDRNCGDNGAVVVTKKASSCDQSETKAREEPPASDSGQTQQQTLQDNLFRLVNPFMALMLVALVMMTFGIYTATLRPPEMTANRSCKQVCHDFNSHHPGVQRHEATSDPINSHIGMQGLNGLAFIISACSGFCWFTKKRQRQRAMEDDAKRAQMRTWAVFVTCMTAVCFCLAAVTLTVVWARPTFNLDHPSLWRGPKDRGEQMVGFKMAAEALAAPIVMGITVYYLTAQLV